MKRLVRLVVALTLALIVFQVAAAQDPIELTLVGYAVPREALGAIIPLFKEYWLEQTGQQVEILESYGASGAQSRAVAGGFEADIVLLSIEPDVTRLVEAGLIDETWKTDNEYEGFAAHSVVILATRPGNPDNITDWADLARDDVEIITPDPATSGGAQWNILGAAGAARRGWVEGYPESEDGADFLEALVGNIAALDRDGRESFLTFERGIGNVAITYENEVYAGIQAGTDYTIVYPRSTLLIQNPVAVVDTYVDLHGTREVAEAFVQFLWTPDAQRIFANHGYRPVNPIVRAEYGIGDEGFEVPADLPPSTIEPDPIIVFPPIEDLFTVDGEFGGWSAARTQYFGDAGLFTQLVAASQN